MVFLLGLNRHPRLAFLVFAFKYKETIKRIILMIKSICRARGPVLNKGTTSVTPFFIYNKLKDIT